MDPADLRRALIRALYIRRASALTASYLHTILKRNTGEQDLKESAVRDEINFFISRGEIESTPDPLGSTQHYSLTAAGTLFAERNGLTD